MGGFEYLYNQYLSIDRRKDFFNSKTLLLIIIKFLLDKMFVDS